MTTEKSPMENLILPINIALYSVMKIGKFNHHLPSGTMHMWRAY